MADICKIKTIDPIWTWCNEEAANNLRNLLSYEYVIWIRERFGKKRKMCKRYLIEGREYGDYFFFSGYVRRCLQYFHMHSIDYEYESDVPELEYDEPNVDGIVFRDYQKELILKALEFGYGVIKSPTGSGKSIVLYGILSCFSRENVLILVHSLDLVQQLYDGIQETGIGPVGIFSAKNPVISRVSISTVNSYYKVANQYKTFWDVVLVDEGHHVANPFQGMYFEALTKTKAPWRFAFTATESDAEEGRFALEGLIGPVIGELTMAEGQELGFLAEAEIIFRVVEIPDDVARLRKDTTYTKLYKLGIVDNFNRNMRIAYEAEKEVKNGGTVLILVKMISHIKAIQDMLDIPVEVVQGSVKKEDRASIKSDLKSGVASCVIATVAWVEGIDIPNLTMIVNAGGGRSERETLQKIGRVLRKTETKTKAKVIEFMDIAQITKNILKTGCNTHMLHKQSIHRWKIYEEQGWEPKLDKSDMYLVK